MPKRVGFLYELIYEWANLLSAYKKGRKSKSDRQDVIEFEFNLENYLVDIQRELREQSYNFGGYFQFKIYEPKERIIHCAPFRDRVVHHAINNVLNGVLDKSIIPDSYACRKDKGLHRAIKRAYYFYQNSRYCYKFDIRKYFYTIDHDILMKKITRRIKDRKVLRLMEDLLRTYDSGIEYYHYFEDDDLIDLMKIRGLPIGNLTSQLFANFYLAELDHFVKEKLHQRFYIRYMDDMLIFSNDYEDLKWAKQEITSKLVSERLQIHPYKNMISNTKRGVNFLGFRFYKNQIRLNNQNLNRLKRKLKIRAELNLPHNEHLLSINGHLGFLKAGHTRKIIECILQEIEFKYNNRRYGFTV